MGQMGIEHGDHMAVSTEGTRLYRILPGKVSYDFVGNPPCNLGKNGHSALLRGQGIVSYGWLVRLP